MALILACDALGKDSLNLVARHLLARYGLHTLREERLKEYDAEVGLNIFAVHHARNGRYIEVGAVGYILQNHRLELTLVAILEVFALEVENGLHRAHQRVVALLDSRDKPFGGVYLRLHDPL